MSRSNFLFAILLFILLTAISCSKMDTERFRGEWDFKAEKLWETSAAGEDQFLRPAEPRIASDGTVFVHDFEKHISYIFDKDGGFKAAFADMGEEPGQVPRYINCFISGDRVVVASFDKLHYFDFDGVFIESIPNNIFERFPLAFINHKEFYASGMRQESGGLAVLEKVGPGGSTVIKEYVLSEEEKKVPGMIILGLTPQILLGFDKESQRIYYGRNNIGEIHVAGSGEADTSRFKLPWQRKPAGEAAKRNHFNRFGIDEDRINAIVPLLPGELAFYHRIQYLNGLIYVFKMDSFGSLASSQAIEIFSPDGIHLYTGIVKLEEGRYFQNPDLIQMIEGFLYAVTVDESGGKALVKYRLAMPDA